VTMGMLPLSFLRSSFLMVCRGHVPILRAPRGNAAEMVAKRLETKIRDAILSASRSHTSSIFSQDTTGLSNLQRPRLSTSLSFVPIQTQLKV
jgi:hypothetical protein